MSRIFTLIGFALFAGMMSFAQCPPDNSYYLNATPDCPGNVTVGCVWGGEYLATNVVEGYLYEFTTCAGFSFDSQLTLYSQTVTVLAYNDDYCGLQSYISWTATYTGIVYLMVDEYPCTWNLTCIPVTIGCTPGQADGDGCNTDVILCQNTAGPFSFGPAGPYISSCLDWFSSSQFAYIMVNVTTTGPLNLLIQGNGTTGYLDVSVFDIPNGVDACEAVQDLNNEIGCNYASAFSGCNQFGNSFPCASSVPAPNVTAGQTVMIIVEDWQNGESSSFTLQLGPPPNAQSGPANATITGAGPFCGNAAPVQLTAQDMGGTWSGPGTIATGEFDPSSAGVGLHTIQYSIGQPPCRSESSTSIMVVDTPDAQGSATDVSICVGESTSLLFTGTPNSVVTFTLNGEPAQQITLDASGQATWPLNGLSGDVSVLLQSVTLPGTPPCTQALTDPPILIDVAPSPAVSPIYHD